MRLELLKLERYSCGPHTAPGRAGVQSHCKDIHVLFSDGEGTLCGTEGGVYDPHSFSFLVTFLGNYSTTSSASHSFEQKECPAGSMFERNSSKCESSNPCNAPPVTCVLSDQVTFLRG